MSNNLAGVKEIKRIVIPLLCNKCMKHTKLYAIKVSETWIDGYFCNDCAREMSKIMGKIIELRRQGMGYRQIAHEVGLHYHTVRKYIQRYFSD